MNTEKKMYSSIIQLDNGSNYEVAESVKLIETLINDKYIRNSTFITFHFPDGFECKLKKGKICAFYENEEN